MSDAIADRITRMTEFIRRSDKANPSSEAIDPKDAATLILIDRSGAEPKVLLGKRHDRHVFMPGKFVFPAAALIPPTSTCRSLASSTNRQRCASCSAFPRAVPCVPERWRSLRSARPARRPVFCSAPARRQGTFRPALGRRSRNTACCRTFRHSFRRPRHHAARTAAPLRRALLHHGRERNRASHRRRHRPRSRAGRAGVDADQGCRNSSTCRRSPA